MSMNSDFAPKTTDYESPTPSPQGDAEVARTAGEQEATLERIAAGLYGVASMLVGAGPDTSVDRDEDGARLVETAVITAEIPRGASAAEARRAGLRALAHGAIELLAKRAPGSLKAPEGVEFPATCIEDDELDAAGMSRDELARMIAGPDRARVRTWLEGLPLEQRVVFVLRAVAAIPAGETAALLAAHGGAGAAGWTADQVREVFRQALCSLASQLLHAANAR